MVSSESNRAACLEWKECHGGWDAFVAAGTDTSDTVCKGQARPVGTASQAMAVVMDDRSAGYVRQHRLDLDFVTSAEFRTLLNSYQEIRDLMTGPVTIRTAAAGPADTADEPETEAERRRNNIYLALFAVVVVGIGVWLVNAMIDARRADECISSGHRHCRMIDVTPR